MSLAIERQRCHECGAYFEPLPETDRNTPIPGQLLGWPIRVVCQKCFDKAGEAARRENRVE